ncbi:MAG TPA: HAMP domain-containing sensor histidine kinase [Allosphingosinicella sp.]|nr:HAMP domain-containing sensor histidine kinase [Allosphingosinicella sp.]
MRRPRRSLARRLTFGFILGNAAAMLLLLLAMYPAALDEDYQPVGPELPLLAVAEDVLPRDGNGIRLRPEGLAKEFSKHHPDMWFIAKVGSNQLTFGPVPQQAPSLLSRMPSGLREARFRGFGMAGPAGEAMVSEVETSAGISLVAAGGVVTSSITFSDYLRYIFGNEFQWVPLLAAALALAGAILVAPILLRGVRPTVRAAAEIGPHDVEKRLPEDRVVKELLPLVRAFNHALDRLAAAFEQRRRFIADVAHELRTPLAVLNMHVEELPSGGVKPDIQRTVFRLSHMVGQMLDAERLSLRGRRREAVDLVELARAATAEVAPLAVANGYEMGFNSARKKTVIDADPDAVSRALGNLVGNAVAHGGGAGTIEVKVSADGKVDVSDEGPGVVAEARERIFEPFHRERWDRDGCGLGLHLVREIMRAHGGEASVVGSSRGATFRLDFSASLKSGGSRDRAGSEATDAYSSQVQSAAHR